MKVQGCKYKGCNPTVQKSNGIYFLLINVWHIRLLIYKIARCEILI